MIYVHFKFEKILNSPKDFTSLHPTRVRIAIGWYGGLVTFQYMVYMHLLVDLTLVDPHFTQALYEECRTHQAIIPRNDIIEVSRFASL